MDLTRPLLEIEKQLWKNDAELYEYHLIEEALQVAADVAVLTYRVTARLGARALQEHRAGQQCVRPPRGLLEAGISSADSSRSGMIPGC